MSLNKINSKIQSLIKNIDDLGDVSGKYTTRGYDYADSSHIVANIRYNGYLDVSDVNKILAAKNLSVFSDEILAEFNSKRLTSVEHHESESQISQFKEQYMENCDLLDFDKIFWVAAYVLNKPYFERTLLDGETLQEYCIRTSDKKFRWYIKEYWEQVITFASFDAFKKYIIDSNKSDFAEYEKRKLIDFDVLCLGRSGGWLSVCETSEIDFECTLSDNFGYDFVDLLKIENDKDFNEMLMDYTELSKKQEFCAKLKDILDNCNAKISFVDEMIERITSECTNFISCAYDRLSEEICDFVHNEDLQNANCTIEVQGNRVVTSLGVCVFLSDFVQLYESIEPFLLKLDVGQRFDIQRKVGNYTVEYAYSTEDKTLIKAGCHRFDLQDVKELVLSAKIK